MKFGKFKCTLKVSSEKGKWENKKIDIIIKSTDPLIHSKFKKSENTSQFPPRVKHWLCKFI